MRFSIHRLQTKRKIRTSSLQTAASTTANGKLSLAFAVAFAVVLSLALPASIAFGDLTDAETDDPEESSQSTTVASDASGASDGKQLYGDEKIEVDILAEELKKAQSSNLIASTKAAAQKIRADIIAARIPEQKERAEEAARNLYKIQQDRYDIAEMLFGSQSIDEFIQNADYLQYITETNVSEITRANEMQQEAEIVREKYEDSRDLAQAQVELASEQLKAAQAERIDRASDGIAEAIGEANSGMGTMLTPEQQKKEEEKEKKEKEKEDKESRSSDSDSDSDDKSGKSSSSDDSKSDSDSNDDDSDSDDKSKKDDEDEEIEEATSDTSDLDDGADWSQSKEEFVEEWAPRLDAYLEGSALAGQGENFAKSAWKYCIDPRWSAAISNTESSKGAKCIRPHNAWGWGAADSDPYNLASEWGSWAEAIDAHAKGLANGYGYTITMSGAQAYCPNTWQSWYNKTLGEMAQI